MKKKDEELRSVRENKRGRFENGLREELIRQIESGTPPEV